jgi:hypothetical protein
LQYQQTTLRAIAPCGAAQVQRGAGRIERVARTQRAAYFHAEARALRRHLLARCLAALRELMADPPLRQPLPSRH